MIYLDHNATAPLCEAAFQSLESSLTSFHGNPASLHRAGQRADRILEDARNVVAESLDLDPSRLLFTSGATEAANAIAHHLGRAHPERPVAAVSTEHVCVLDAIRHHVPRGTNLLSVDPSGRPDPFSNAPSLPPPSALFAMLANNETGMLQDLNRLVSQPEWAAIPLAVDATQAIGRIPLSFPQTVRDEGFIFGSCHKMGGPIGIGFLHLPKNIRWIALLQGGGQEDGRRSGTQNAPLAAAFAAAMKDRVARFSEISARSAFRASIANALQDAHRGVRVLGEPSSCLWNTIAFLAPELPDCRHRWTVRLDKAGFAVSSGSACSAGAGKASHVLRALQLTESEADRVLRISWGWETPQEHLEQFVETFRSLCSTVPRGT